MSVHPDPNALPPAKPMPHNWARGFGLFAVLSAPLGQRNAVIVDFGLVGGPRATVLFDAEGLFTFAALDRLGNERRVRVDPALIAGGIRHLLICEITPLIVGEWSLSMLIDGQEVAQATLSADFYIDVPNNLLSVGIDMLSHRPGRFHLLSLGTFAEPIPADTKVKLMKWSFARHEVGRHG